VTDAARGLGIDIAALEQIVEAADAVPMIAVAFDE
jgi:hypothetical protein